MLQRKTTLDASEAMLQRMSEATLCRMNLSTSITKLMNNPAETATNPRRETIVRMLQPSPSKPSLSSSSSG